MKSRALGKTTVRGKKTAKKVRHMDINSKCRAVCSGMYGRIDTFFYIDLIW